MKRIKQFLRSLSFYYPFTFAGTTLFLVSGFLLGRSYAFKNPFGIFLAAAALGIVLLFAILGRVQADRFEKVQISWESFEPLYAGRKGSRQRLDARERGTFLFFRIHFAVYGPLQVGKQAKLLFYKEVSFPGNGSLDIPLLFPLCGVFRARGKAAVKDIFTLTRARFMTVLHREIPVQPSLIKEERTVPVQVAGGEDTKERRKTSDEEKYYMREYVPGDRFRDINWKATSKLNDIVTRISPMTQDKTRIIFIDFRHYKKSKGETRQAVFHLHYCKSWLISFLWNTKREHPEYQFHLSTGKGLVLLESEDDIKRFSLSLPGLFYQHEPAEIRQIIGVNRLFIFTTPYDNGLSGYIGRFSGIPVTVFRTAFPKPTARKEEAEAGVNERIVRFTTLPSQPYLPMPWVLKSDKERTNPGIGPFVTELHEREVTVTL